MTTVEVSSDPEQPPDFLKSIERYCAAVLEHLHIVDWQLSVHLCDDERIHALNLRYRGVDRPTDVLSFGPYETLPTGASMERCVGDIVISLERAGENAQRYGIDPQLELRRLLVHAVLHLRGFDHSSRAEESEPMLRLQSRIIQAVPLDQSI